MVNEAGAASEGGWGPGQEGQRAGGGGAGGCGEENVGLCCTGCDAEEEMLDL